MPHGTRPTNLQATSASDEPQLPALTGYSGRSGYDPIKAALSVYPYGEFRRVTARVETGRVPYADGYNIPNSYSQAPGGSVGNSYGANSQVAAPLRGTSRSAAAAKNTDGIYLPQKPVDVKGYRVGYKAKKYELDDTEFKHKKGFRYGYTYGHRFFEPMPIRFAGLNDPFYMYPFGKGGAIYGGSGYSFDEGKAHRSRKEFSEDDKAEKAGGYLSASYETPKEQAAVQRTTYPTSPQQRTHAAPLQSNYAPTQQRGYGPSVPSAYIGRHPTPYITPQSSNVARHAAPYPARQHNTYAALNPERYSRQQGLQARRFLPQQPPRTYARSLHSPATPYQPVSVGRPTSLVTAVQHPTHLVPRQTRSNYY